MELFSSKFNIDFLASKKIVALFSLILAIFAISSLSIYGLRWGLDFTGGTQIELAFEQAPDLSQVRAKLSDNGFEQFLVQNYGTSTDLLVSIPTVDSINNSAVNTVAKLFPSAKLQRSEYIGPQVGAELMQKGIFAIIISVLCTMVYIAFRFEYRLAICSAVALAHDPLVVLGIFSFLQLEFDLKTLAALLAVIGYSLNDTIVVFDRVRENFRKYRKKQPADIMNLSINQTLSRTIITSALTLIVVIALYLYGGEGLRGFSLVMILGVIFGTYSSIYIAGILAIHLGLTRDDMIEKPRVVDELP